MQYINKDPVPRKKLMVKYKDYKRNHVILPGREKALEAFLKSILEDQDVTGEHRARRLRLFGLGL